MPDVPQWQPAPAPTLAFAAAQADMRIGTWVYASPYEHPGRRHGRRTRCRSSPRAALWPEGPSAGCRSSRHGHLRHVHERHPCRHRHDGARVPREARYRDPYTSSPVPKPNEQPEPSGVSWTIRTPAAGCTSRSLSHRWKRHGIRVVRRRAGIPRRRARTPAPATHAEPMDDPPAALRSETRRLRARHSRLGALANAECRSCR
jgi:hypothetical protein